MMQSTQTGPFAGQSASEACKLLQRFAGYWWPRFWPLLRGNILWRIVPDNVNDLNTFSKDYAPCIAELEKRIIQLGLNSEDGYQLSSFVHNIAHHCHHKRRNHILATARAILLSPDMNTAEITDATERSVFRDGYLSHKGNPSKDPALDGAPAKETLGKRGKETLALHDDFRFPTCRITCQTQTLLELIHQALQESTNNQSADDATRQYLLVRDLLNLFLASAPIRQASQGTASGSFAQTVLLYTDCDYIARHIVVLGRLQRDKWPASLAQVAALGDLIPEFRRVGRNAFKSMTSTQCKLLCQGIVDAASSPGEREDLRFESVEKALRSAIFQLGDWSKAFK
ncbi:ribosome biogenesis protein ytm1, partial [Dimargaris verticillata]